MKNNETYLSNEITSLMEEKTASNEKIDVCKNAFAQQIKNGLGNDIKNELKPKEKSKISKFFDKLFSVYG